jgi:hypothetical protein
MPRTLSNTALASMNAQATGEVWLVLLTISHATLPTPIRLVNNNEDVVSRSNTFIAFPFEIELPGEDPDQPPKAMLRIDNVDRRVVQTIRSITAPPTITLEVILASAPNNVEVSFTNMTLRNAQYDVSTVSGELTFDSIYTEPVTLTMTPNRFPALF